MGRLEDVRKLDIGSGLRPMHGYVGIDRCAVPPELANHIVRHDLCNGRPWPFADGQMEALCSCHFIEHVPTEDVQAHVFLKAAPPGYEPSTVPTGFLGATVKKDALGWVLDEAYRIAQVGARFDLIWPALIDERTGQIQVAAFADPTHRRFIPAEQIDRYFTSAGRKALGVEHYGFDCDWHIVTQVQRGREGIIENYYVLEKR